MISLFFSPISLSGLVGSNHDLSQHITPYLVHKGAQKRLLNKWMIIEWINKGIRLQSPFALFDSLVVSLFTWTCKSWWSHKAVSCHVASRELWSVDQHLPESRHGQMGVCLPCPHGSQKTGSAHSSPVDSQEIWLWNRSKRLGSAGGLEKKRSEQVCMDVGSFSWSSVLFTHHSPQTTLWEEPVHGTGHGHTAIDYEEGLVNEMLKGPHYKTIPSITWFTAWPLSVQFGRSVMSDSLQPHGLQHIRLPHPSPTPGACSNSCPLSRSCHPTISSSVIPFSSHLQSSPASGSFQMTQLFPSGGQSIGVSASASVLPMNIQDWFPLGWTGSIFLQSKGLSRVLSNTTVQKLLRHSAFFRVQLSHPHMTTGKTIALTRRTFVGPYDRPICRDSQVYQQ